MADAPYMMFIGLDTGPELDRDRQMLQRFNDNYNQIHAADVTNMNPGFVRGTRYELIEPDARGDFGPRWLVIYEMNSEAAAQGYGIRFDGPPEGRPQYRPDGLAGVDAPLRWRMFWRRHAPAAGELGAAAAPYIFMVGMNAAPGSDEAGMRAFDEFYTHTHVPEVVASSRFLRGTRYELYRDYTHPAPGAPRFLAVYEFDEAGIVARAMRAANPQLGGAGLSAGPPAWEGHETLWRLTYRRVTSYVREGLLLSGSDAPSP